MRYYFTFPTSLGPGCRATEHGKLSGNLKHKNETFNLNSSQELKNTLYFCLSRSSGFCLVKGSGLGSGGWMGGCFLWSCSPQRKMGRRCLPASGGVSAGSWCESASLCPAAQGTLAVSPQRGPSERPRPSHPCPGGHTGMCTTASHRLKTHNRVIVPIST